MRGINGLVVCCRSKPVIFAFVKITGPELYRISSQLWALCLLKAFWRTETRPFHLEKQTLFKMKTFSLPLLIDFGGFAARMRSDREWWQIVNRNKFSLIFFLSSRRLFGFDQTELIDDKHSTCLHSRFTQGNATLSLFQGPVDWFLSTASFPTFTFVILASAARYRRDESLFNVVRLARVESAKRK